MIKHTNKNLVFSTALLTMLISQISYSDIDFKGFASVGGGIFSEDTFEYIGVDDSFNSSRFNRFGLQLTSQVNERTTFTGQLVARGQEDYTLKAEWLYLTLDVADSTDVRVGRIRSPLFFFSDFLEVGYAYPWIIPPSEVYRIGFSGVDGIDLVNNHDLGNWSATFQIYFGESESDISVSGNIVTFKLQDFTGINYTVSNDWLSLRASYNQATFSTESATLSALATGLNTIGATAAAEALNPQEEDTAFWGLALNVDLEKVIFTTEYTVTDPDKQSIASEDFAWYTTFGYRFGALTPHITYSYQENDPNLSFLDSIPAIDNPSINGLRAAASGVVNEFEDTSIILGVRYDYAPGTAFKFEITTIDQDKQDRDGTVVAFAIDTVF